jgi:glycosyltransferase involved in cell wall biosynthesis
MKIALVHSFYRSDVPSGENIVVGRQVDALTAAGHDVLLVSRHTDEEERRPAYAARTALAVATGSGHDPTDEIRAFKPDIVHVHNLFPNFSERWLARWPGPLVATLHNYRPLCANALLFRDGHACTECPKKGSWRAVRHGCYRGSRLASVPMAVHNAGGPQRNRLLARADSLVALSPRSRRLYTSAAPELADRLNVIPNGLPDRSSPALAERRHWCFVGRLSPEKGIAELLAAWPAQEPLVIIGDGPLRPQLEASAPPSVRFLGRLDSDGVDATLRASWGLIFPSTWAEGFPTVVAEALMHGTPIVALVGNSAADLIDDWGTGGTYSSGTSLRQALASIRSDFEPLSSRCRRAYEDNLTEDVWVRRLERMYGHAAGGSPDACL